MPDTSVANSDVAIYAGAVGTFLAALIAGLGLKRGGEDRDKPAPTAEAAGPMGLIVEEAILRDIVSVLRDVLEELKGWREDFEDSRREDVDRRQADKLHRAEDENVELRGKLETLQMGQKHTHSKQDEYGAKVGELLEILKNPELTAALSKLRLG